MTLPSSVSQEQPCHTTRLRPYRHDGIAIEEPFRAEALAYLDVPHGSLQYASAIIVEKDTRDPLTQACSMGPWLKCGHTIPSPAIHAAYPVTVQMIRQLIERTRQSSSK